MSNLNLIIGDSRIRPALVVRNLGAWQDQFLDMSHHVTETCRSCFKQLYCIKRIRPFLSQSATELLIQSLVRSKLDYCNSLLSGASQHNVLKLQRVQNFSARIVLKLPRRAHITPALYCLH